MLYGARPKGWTLVELVIVLVILGVLAYVVVRSLRPGEVQALQQAERLRDDLRYTQMLAMNQGRAKELRLGVPASPASCAGSAYYVIDCTAGGANPCTAAPNDAIADAREPGGFLCVALPDGLALGGANLYFDPLGRPKDATGLITANATFTVSGGGTQRTAVVTPLTGFATAQ